MIAEAVVATALLALACWWRWAATRDRPQWCKCGHAVDHHRHHNRGRYCGMAGCPCDRFRAEL